MKKILAIGNSFSQDSTAYLHDMAKHGDIETKVVNLYIGGCSLQRHDENIKNDDVAYVYELNGSEIGRLVSIKEALTEDNWDVVTMQQASHDSGVEETYFPYINNLSDYIKTYAPNAVQMLHQTWAYEIDSEHEGFARYSNDQQKMYQALKSAYEKAAAMLKLPIIPCGDIIQRLRTLTEFDYENHGQSLCRDGFHMHFIYGRYATAAVWYQAIFKKSILDNSFMPPKVDEKAYNEELIKLIRDNIGNY